MKTYITDVFDKIKKYSEKLDDLSILTDKHWVVFNENELVKITYIFQSSGTLLISINGKVTISKWEYLGNNSLLIYVEEDAYLFKKAFIDKNILALKVDGVKEYAILLDENDINNQIQNLNTLELLIQNNYIHSSVEANLDRNVFENNEDYRLVDGFKDNLGVIINSDLNYGFINENNEIVKSCTFEFAENFSCGLALVRENNKFGYLNEDFNYVIEPIYDRAESFANGKAEVRIQNRKITINTKGNVI